MTILGLGEDVIKVGKAVQWDLALKDIWSLGFPPPHFLLLGLQEVSKSASCFAVMMSSLMNGPSKGIRHPWNETIEISQNKYFVLFFFFCQGFITVRKS